MLLLLPLKSSLVIPLWDATHTTAQAMLKMKSARFEKASEEIGVPRGKKSERYRSTPHYRSRSLKMKSARFEKASEEIGVKDSEGIYRSTAHRQTDRQQFIQVQSFSLPMVGPPEQKVNP